jgi:hypothetical protein
MSDGEQLRGLQHTGCLKVLRLVNIQQSRASIRAQGSTVNPSIKHDHQA